jgi:hypothetical protein
MKKFKIYKQETEHSCGIACLRGVMNYYGNDFSEKDIWDKHESYKAKNGGTLNPILNLGVTALKFGFDVIYLGYNLIIATDNPSKGLKESLEERSNKYFEFGKYYIDEALKFISLGGRIDIDKLNLKRIKELVRKNKFVLVEIRPTFIYGKGPISMDHKVIIIGYSKEGFRVLDPSDAKEHVSSHFMQGLPRC